MSLPIEPKQKLVFSDDGFRGGVSIIPTDSNVEQELHGGRVGAGNLSFSSLGLSIPVGLYSIPYKKTQHNTSDKEASIIGGDLFDKLFSAVSKR